MVSNEAKWNQTVYTKKFRVCFHLASGNDLTAQYHTSRNSCRILKGFRQLFLHRKKPLKVHACEKTVLALCICFCYTDLVNFLTGRIALLQRSFEFCGNRFACAFYDTNAKTSGWNECLAAGYLRRRICAKSLFLQRPRAAAQTFLAGWRALQSQRVALLGRHAILRLNVVGDLGVLPRACAQREVSFLAGPDVQLVADQVRCDARQQIRRLFGVDNA